MTTSRFPAVWLADGAAIELNEFPVLFPALTWLTSMMVVVFGGFTGLKAAATMAQGCELGPQDILGITGPGAVMLLSSSPLNVAILESRSVKPGPGLKVMPTAPTVAPTTTKPPTREEVTAGATPEVAAPDPLALAWESRGLLGSAPEYCKTLIVSQASGEAKWHVTTLLVLPLMFLAYHI